MNIFEKIPDSSECEHIETLYDNGKTKIERIISFGNVSGEDFWYNQEQDEWILLASGHAKIQLDNGEIIELNKGDTYLLKAHLKHKVIYTSKEPECIWICVYL